MSGGGVGFRLRPGRPTDAEPFLRLWDEAIDWMVARGQSEQWGTEPASVRPRNRALVDAWTRGADMTVAETGERGELLGVSVVTRQHPDYAPPLTQPELYLLLLLVSRRHGGRGIGAELIRHAAERAIASGAEVLRVDCWAGAPALVQYYERQGFIPSARYSRGDWHGQIFELPLG